jgi:small GTP-binding protein
MVTRRLSYNRDVSRKIILLGNTGVGKTSLVTRWVDGHWDPESPPTIGTSNSFKNVEIGQKTVKVTIWDTAGQEQFRSITPLYVRGARAAIIVASTDSPNSFDAIPSWLEMVGITLTKSIELYRSNFVTIFTVSAPTGQKVDELFLKASRIVDNSLVEAADAEISPAINPPPDKSECC